MRNINFANLKQRIRNGFVAALFISAQVGAVTVPFFNVSVAHAAPVCIIDQQGANDQPGQKDLTQFCEDTGANSIGWNWDELSVSGNGQSLDACALFDTDGDGFANRALCVTTQDGDPFTSIVYTCNDSRADRCAGANAGTPATSSCTVGVTATQPFVAGADSPNDLTATCTPTIADTASGDLIDVCSFPSGQPNSDPSDCVVARPKAGKLEIIKDLVPNADPGKFNLQIDNSTAGTGANVGDNGTTGEVVVSQGSHSVGETAGTNTSLGSYTSSISCRDLNGTGAVIASGSGTSLANVAIADGADVICTITNTLQTGSITLVKNVVNNNGGQATANQFGLTIGGNAVTSGQQVVLTPGSYAINEAGLAGYSFVNITGTGCPTTLGGVVNLTNGQNITCTITNDDIAPTLTLVKTVTNNNGGTATAANFQGKIDGNNVAWSTVIPLSAGNHTATEAALAGGAGYTASAWSGDCAANGSITLSVGQNAVCNITNDDNAPSLTLNKIISNTHGGTATEANWLLAATGPTSISGPGAVGNTDVVSDSNFAAGTYTLSENGGPSGYSASAWTCTNNVTVTNNQITLTNGQTTVCSITNSDIAPILVILKQVLNSYGTPLSPDSFLLTVDGNSVTSGAQNTQFNAGAHTVGETQQPGYSFTSFTGSNCSVVNGTLTAIGIIGGTTTCTVTNTAIQPKLIVIKNVVNDNGGTKTAGNFTMTVSGNSQNVPNFAGSEVGIEIGLNEGSYSVDELADAGYAKSLSADCSGTIAVGQTKTCTITNDDIAPQLTIVKHVVNNNVGFADADDFTMNVTGTNVSDSSFPGSEAPGTTVTLNAGNYSVGEDLVAGYTPSLSADCSGTIALGEAKTCTVTNTAQPGSISGMKCDANVSDTDCSSGLGLEGWTIYLDLNNSKTFDLGEPSDVTDVNGEYTISNLAPGTYTVREINVTDWTQIFPGSPKDELAVTLVQGENSVGNDFGNRRDTGTITVVKQLTPETNAGKFNLRINGTAYVTNVGDNGTTGAVSLPTGSGYFVSETASTDTTLSDYETSYQCLDGNTVVASGDTTTTSELTLTKNQNIVCTFFNNKGEILGETVPVLVNTGSNILLATAAGLLLISTVITVAVATRRVAARS